MLVLGLMFIAWFELAAQLTLYVIMSPQSSVSSVRAEDVTRLKSAWMSAASGIVCVPRTLLGTRIVTTVHLYLFPPFDESSIYTVTSVLTQRELDHHCSVFNIPAELRPELPDRNSTIKDSPEGKIGMYTRFIEFANYRVPLSKFLLCILEYYQIHLSLLSVIGAGKIDASVCPQSFLWFSGTSVVKDPLPVDEAVDLPCVELLNENRTLIRKYPRTFLCFVGLSRSFTDTDVRLTLLHDNDEEMGLLDFVKSADPFKVKVEDRTLAKNEVPLITKTEDRVISPSAQTVSLVDHNIQDELNVNSGKRKKRAAFVSGSPPRLIRQGEQADAGSGSVAAATEDITSSSVTPTLEHALEDAFHDNVRTPGVSLLTAESASDGHPASTPEFETGTLSVTPSHGSSVDDFYESQIVDSATAMNVYVPNWNVANNAQIDNPAICQNLLDHVTPPGYWAAIRNQHDVAFLDSVNINSAQHQRDAEVADLKVKLERLESKDAEVEELHKHVSNLEALVVVKSGEVVGEGKMWEEFVMQQDAAERRFTKRTAELNTRIADMRRDMDNDLYPHMLTAIAGRRWVVGHGFRLVVYKCARSVECHSALGKVISMAINKGIQQGLEAGIVHGKAVIMFALILKDDQGNRDAALEFARFQPFIDQVVVPVYSESGSIEREMLLSDAILPDSSAARRGYVCFKLYLGEDSGSRSPRYFPWRHRLSGFYLSPGQ
ncbi:hypothetical protein Tco_0658668 [Tanacetum coccineum]